MNKGIGTTLLFLSCFLVLIALQSYYVYNSYLLEEKELNKQVKIIADDVVKQLEKYETDASEDSLILSLKKLSSNQLFMNQKLDERKQWFTFKNFYEKEVDSILDKKTASTNFKIALRSEIYSVYDENRKLELLSKKHPLILFKTKAPVSAGFVFSEGKWNSNFTERDTELKVDAHYHYIIRSRISVELINLSALVFKKILPLSLVSLAIIALLTYLFWRTTKNLKLQQSKLAQLYTSIDSISHELSTPIATLKFSLAGMPASDNKQLFERQIQRLEKVASAVRNPEVDSELIDEAAIKAYIDQTLKRFSGVSIDFDFAFKANTQLSKHDFEQLLNNLIENAVKYRANHIEVKLDFSSQINIEVADNGIGIPKDAQAYIFDKYYRVSRPENLQITGLGLGLHIVKQTIDKYLGSIDVSTNATNGVTFNISLPHA
ncbi:sensor histidine kinase [Pedobacter sp.]